MDRDQQDLLGVIRQVKQGEAHHMTDQIPEERGASVSTVRWPTWVARHELPVFFALTFVLSWLFWPFTLLNSDSSPAGRRAAQTPGSRRHLHRASRVHVRAVGSSSRLPFRLRLTD